ncbi:hypothetical protein CEP54_006990 [Fusarium duplospermum]|uniref:Uncharacterized protein n=1 Tax=Fusarium duplospermum TaxID=1325734 RepID=A0A428Q445_9HYPO|nr:hypothetical protein CEP54_006990 [Fusarium duplospermum]
MQPALTSHANQQVAESSERKILFAVTRLRNSRAHSPSQASGLLMFGSMLTNPRGSAFPPSQTLPLPTRLDTHPSSLFITPIEYPVRDIRAVAWLHSFFRLRATFSSLHSCSTITERRLLHLATRGFLTRSRRPRANPTVRILVARDTLVLCR